MGCLEQQFLLQIESPRIWENLVESDFFCTSLLIHHFENFAILYIFFLSNLLPAIMNYEGVCNQKKIKQNNVLGFLKNVTRHSNWNDRRDKKLDEIHLLIEMVGLGQV